MNRDKLFFWHLILHYFDLKKTAAETQRLLSEVYGDAFLKRLITGDEKWIVYNNVVRKRSWSRHDDSFQTTSKADIYQNHDTL